MKNEENSLLIIKLSHELFKGASIPDDNIKLPTVTKIFFVFWLQKKNALLFCRDPVSLCCNSLSFVLSKKTAGTVKLGGEKAATYPGRHYCKPGRDAASGFFDNSSSLLCHLEGGDEVIM